MEKKETKMKMAKMPFSAHGSSGVVDVLHNGRWYKATVLSVDTASLATVRYAVDGSVESKVEDSRIRPRQKAQSAAAKVQQQNSDLEKRSPARGAPMVKGPPMRTLGTLVISHREMEKHHPGHLALEHQRRLPAVMTNM